MPLSETLMHLSCTFVSLMVMRGKHTWVHAMRNAQLRDHDEDAASDDSDATQPVPCVQETVGRRPGHLPVRLFIIIALLQQFSYGEEVFLVDAFSGRGAISWAFQRHEKKVARLDISLNPLDEALLCN